MTIIRTNTDGKITITGLAPGSYVFTVAAINAVGTGAPSAPSVPVTIPVPGYPFAAVYQPPLTCSGNRLQVSGRDVRWGGANLFWLGQDDNQGLTLAPQEMISSALDGASQMGAGLVRSHTIGISAGNSLSYETAPGVFSDANLASADWAVYKRQSKVSGSWCH